MQGRFFATSDGHSYFSPSGKQSGTALPQASAPSNTAATATSQAQPSAGSSGQNIVEQYNGCLPRNDDVPRKPVAAMSFGQRVRVARLFSGHEEFLDQVIRVGGWAKSVRAQKGMVFVQINDGSHFKDLQVVVNEGVAGFDDASKAIVGASFVFKGTLIKSPAKGQPFELSLTDDQHSAYMTGGCDGTYPIQGRPKPETLREQAHLRSRTNTFGAVTRVRNNLAYATHTFFQTRGFLYIHTPIITASDCEGAGEMFQVTTCLPEHNQPITGVKKVEFNKVDKTDEEKKAIQDAKKAKEGDKKKAKKGKKNVAEEVKEEDLYNLVPIPLAEQKVDYKQDMFGKPAFLSVSGQLNVETYAVGMGDCYTFGPTFRAENSHTSRHLCEFWMIEPEMTFATLPDDMDCAEDYLKFCLKYVLLNNRDDLQFFDDRIEKGLIARLEKVINTPFARVTYTDAVKTLEDHIKTKKIKFDEDKPVFWGCDLASEHEKYLTDKVYEGPIIVYDYPKDIKAFYMKMNDDGKTVQAMDVLVPKIGEVVGGSAREDNLEKLDKRIEEMKLDKEAYWWYRDLRKYGSVPHCGFGLGFERLVMMATGMENIKDVIPFPRAPGQAEF